MSRESTRSVGLAGNMQRGPEADNIAGKPNAAPVSMLQCLVCPDGEARLFTQGRDRLFHIAPGVYSLYRCQSCRCIFQHPLPQQEAIRGFYPDTYWWAEKANPTTGLSGLFLRFERAYREFVASDHVRFLQHCVRGMGTGKRMLLDIGCGSGLFLHLAQRRGFVSHGMDLSARAVQVVRSQYGIDARQGAIGDDVWKGIRFDIITMFHVLEHLTNPREALSFARNLLKPGGGLIIQVPNIESLQARVFGRRWYGLDLPRHIINYSPAGLHFLLRDAGLQIRGTARFSLRDNPASIASSLAPWLDPVGRGARRLRQRVFASALLDSSYFGLVLMCLPLAFFESALGLGGTLWIHASPIEGC